MRVGTIYGTRRFIIVNEYRSVRDHRQEGFTNWDRGRIMPALEEALKLPELAGLQYGKALVPGCGRVHTAPVMFCEGSFSELI